MLYLSCSKLISIFRLANFCQFFDRNFLSVLPFRKKLLMIRCSKRATIAIGGAIIRVCGKKFFVGVGCGVWASAVSSAERVWGVGFYRFSGKKSKFRLPQGF
jgi:hypothetical protein